MKNNAVEHRLLDCTLNAMSGRSAYSRSLTDALQIVGAIAASGLVILPAEPTPEMLAAGAAVGDLSEETVRAVLNAVVGAAG